MENILLFYLLSFLIVSSSFCVVIANNPVYSALSLVVSMVALSGVFYLLGAHFIAGVQLIVYAGAVMVLFVMVLMLFDLKKELGSFSRGFFSGVLKLMCGGIILGLIMGAAERSTDMLVSLNNNGEAIGSAVDVKNLAQLLFSKYLLAFEVLGILLLIIAVGVVAVSRTKGGTHARS